MKLFIEADTLKGILDRYVWGHSGLLALISFILLLGYLLYRNLKMFFKPPPEKQDIYMGTGRIYVYFASDSGGDDGEFPFS